MSIQYKYELPISGNGDICSPWLARKTRGNEGSGIYLRRRIMMYEPQISQLIDIVVHFFSCITF